MPTKDCLSLTGVNSLLTAIFLHSCNLAFLHGILFLCGRNVDNNIYYNIYYYQTSFLPFFPTLCKDARMQDCKVFGERHFLIYLIFKQLRKPQCYLTFAKFMDSVPMTLQIRIKTLIPKHAKAEKLCLSAQK